MIIRFARHQINPIFRRTQTGAVNWANSKGLYTTGTERWHSNLFAAATISQACPELHYFVDRWTWFQFYLDDIRDKNPVNDLTAGSTLGRQQEIVVQRLLPSDYLETILAQLMNQAARILRPGNNTFFQGITHRHYGALGEELAHRYTRTFLEWEDYVNLRMLTAGFDMYLAFIAEAAGVEVQEWLAQDVLSLWNQVVLHCALTNDLDSLDEESESAVSADYRFRSREVSRKVAQEINRLGQSIVELTPQFPTVGLAAWGALEWSSRTQRYLP